MPCTADLERRDYLDFLPKRPQGTTKILGTSAFAGTKTPAALKFPSKDATTDCVETPVNCPYISGPRAARTAGGWPTKHLPAGRRAGRSDRQSVGSDASPLSCFLFRPRKRLERCRKRSHTNVSNASVIRTSRVSQTLLQTPLPCFHASINEYYTAKNGLGTIAPRLLSQVKVGTHSPFGERSHTRAHTPEQGCFGRGWYHYPRTVSHVSETLRGRVSERQTLPLLGLGRVYARRTQKACGTAMRLCASLFRGVAAPLGCVICLQLGDVAVFSLCAQYFLNVRGGGGITTLGAFHTVRKPCVAVA